MAKPNVHTASRDELAEAGVRAELVDEILKRRRRKGGVTLKSLGEVPGVGPATLEQLGKALDFQEPPSHETETQDKPQPSRNGRPANDRGGDERTVQQASQQAEQAADTVRGAVETGIRATAQGARAGLQVVQRTAEAAEATQRGVVERSAEDASAFGRSFLELLQEQSRENVAAMTALSRAQGLDEVVRVQGEYLRGTLERMTELNRRWLELAGQMWPGVVLAEDRGEGDRTARYEPKPLETRPQ